MAENETTKVSLNEWLSRFSREDTEATIYKQEIVCTVRVRFKADLSLFRGKDPEEGFLGGIGIQLSQIGDSELGAFLSDELGDSNTPEGIAEAMKQVFGIDPDVPLWQLEDIEGQ